MTAKQGAWTDRGRRGVAAGVGILFAAGAAYAGDIEVVSVNVSPTLVYAPYEWQVPTPNTLLTNGTAVEVGGAQLWQIAPTWNQLASKAQMGWSGSLLDTDFSQNGKADATFLSGGTMTITGEIYDISGFMLLFSGVLLEAEVSAFRVTETNDSDVIRFEQGATVHPIGGFLLNNAMGMTLVGDYYFNGTVSAMNQNGGGLEDFQDGVMTTAGFQFTLVQIPEPATALLFCGVFALLAARRRKTV